MLLDFLPSEGPRPRGKRGKRGKRGLKSESSDARTSIDSALSIELDDDIKRNAANDKAVPTQAAKAAAAAATSAAAA